MPATIEWSAVEAGLLEIAISDPYSLDDLLAVMYASRRLIDETEEEARLLIDMAEVSFLPDSMLYHLNEIAQLLQTRVAQIIVVVNSEIAEELGGLVDHMFPYASVVNVPRPPRPRWGYRAKPPA